MRTTKKLYLFGREFEVGEEILEVWFAFFLSKIDFDGESPGGCWRWRGQLRNGYGLTELNAQSHTAHRASYRALVGPIPAGYHIHHLCEVKNCVNPEHLQPLTPLAHLLATPQAPQHMKPGYTHCVRGHELTPENLYPTKSGHRRCKECTKMWANRAHEEKRKAKPPKLRATHCKYGHPWSEENTYHSGGKKFCRTCHRMVTKFEYAKQQTTLREMAAKEPQKYSYVKPEPIPDSCKRGHPYVEFKANGKPKACKKCQAMQMAVYYNRARGHTEKVKLLEEQLNAAIVRKGGSES